MSFNKVIQIGRLTRDPENVPTKTGTSLVKFSLASDTGFGDNKKAMFIEVTCFGKTAEFVEKNFTKGKEILVEGSLSFEQWEDATSGAKRSKHTIIASQVGFVGSNKKEDDNKSLVDKVVGGNNDIMNEADVPF